MRFARDWNRYRSMLDIVYSVKTCFIRFSCSLRWMYRNPVAAKRPMGRLKRSLDFMVPSPMMKTRDVSISSVLSMRSLSAH